MENEMRGQGMKNIKFNVTIDNISLFFFNFVDYSNPIC